MREVSAHRRYLGGETEASEAWNRRALDLLTHAWAPACDIAARLYDDASTLCPKATDARARVRIEIRGALQRLHEAGTIEATEKAPRQYRRKNATPEAEAIL